MSQRYKLIDDLMHSLAHLDVVTIPWKQIKQWPTNEVDAIENVGLVKLRIIVDQPQSSNPESINATSLACSSEAALTNPSPAHATADDHALDLVQLPGIDIFKSLKLLQENSLARKVEKQMKRFNAQLAEIRSPIVRLQDIINKTKLPPVESLGWQLTRQEFVEWVACELGMIHQPEASNNDVYRLYTLSPQGVYVNSATIDMRDSVNLLISGHILTLIDLIAINCPQQVDKHIQESSLLGKSYVQIDTKKINQLLKASSPMDNVKKIAKEELSKQRKLIAKKAANARHDQPGGTRDIQEKVVKEWQTNNHKYKSRDDCAAKVSREVGCSVRTARKALVNVLPYPTPKK